MSSPIKPLADRVVAVREQANERTASGIYLPTNSQEKQAIAKIVAIGPDVNQVKVDDKIIYKEYSATELKIDATDYLIVKQDDILATL